MVQHGFKECKQLEQHRRLYKLKMKLYDAPTRLNLLDKMEVFEEAMTKSSLMKVVCEFLIVIWRWNIEENKQER